MVFLTSLSSMLSHVGQWGQATVTGFGATTITTVTTTNCFAYTGVSKEEAEHLRLSRVFDYTLLLPSSLSSPCVGDCVASVVDTDGRTVVASGKVEEIAEFSHWEHNLQFFVCGITRAGTWTGS